LLLLSTKEFRKLLKGPVSWIKLKTLSQWCKNQSKVCFDHFHSTLISNRDRRFNHFHSTPILNRDRHNLQMLWLSFNWL
jgi:hypothetical protein